MRGVIGGLVTYLLINYLFGWGYLLYFDQKHKEGWLWFFVIAFSAHAGATADKILTELRKKS